MESRLSNKTYVDRESRSVLTLEWGTELSCQQSHSEHMLDRSRLKEEWFKNMERGTMEHRLRAFFLNNSPKTFRFEAPSSIFDMFKAKHLGYLVEKKWLKPAKMKIVEVEVKDVFPYNAQHYPQSLGPAVRIVTVDHECNFYPWSHE